jgi:hypothetical protein
MSPAVKGLSFGWATLRKKSPRIRQIPEYRQMYMVVDEMKGIDHAHA